MKFLLIPIVLGFLLLLFAAIGLSGGLGGLNTSSPGRGGSGGGIWVSEDDGRTFELRGAIEGGDNATMSREITGLIPGSENESLFAVSPRQGVFRTNNRGESWQHIFAGDVEATVVAVNPNDDSEVYVGAILNRKARIYKKSNSLEDWTEIYVDAVNRTEFVGLHVDRNNPDIVLGLLSNGTLIKSFNGGRDWVLASRVPASATGLYVDVRNPDNIYVSSLESVFKSTNGGFDFEQMNLNIRGNAFVGTQVSSLTTNPNNSAEVYVGSLGEMSRTSNRGETWESINILTPSANVPVQKIALNSQNTNRIYYVAGSVLYTSQNRGESWKTRELPPGVSTVSQILVDAQNNDILYIAAQ